jgi:hypothetical protein
MAITFDYVILPHHKKQDGTNYIRIRVTHKRQSKYIKTNIAVEPEDLTRSGNLKDEGKKDLALEEIKKMRRVASKFSDYVTSTMDVGEIVELINTKLKEEEGFELDFIEYGMTVAKTMKEGTAGNYLVALNALLRYFKGRHPDISEITVRTMREFEEFLRVESNMLYHRDTELLHERKNVKKKDKTIQNYISLIRAIYKRARRQFNEPDRNYFPIPIDIFEYYQPKKVQVVREPKDIPMEWVQLMIDQRTTLRKRERLGVDVFLLSFGLMGINVVDLFTIAEKPRDGVLHYYRTKTKDTKEDGAEMYVRIEPCIAAIMSEYRSRSRVFSFHERYVDVKGFNVAVNEGLRQWIQRNKLNKDFTFYAARHTWGTIAASKKVGIDYGVVTEGLCHSDRSRRMDLVYIRKDWEKVWDANAKVLSLFDWNI